MICYISHDIAGCEEIYTHLKSNPSYNTLTNEATLIIFKKIDNQDHMLLNYEPEWQR